MEPDKLSVAAIFQGMWAVAAANVGMLIGVIVVLTGANILVDLIPTASGTTFIGGVVSLIAQYSFFRVALDKAGRGKANGFGRFWVMNLISGLAMLVAALALILPAFYIASRWAIAAPLLMTKDVGATDSLRESWQATQQSAWALVGVMLVLFVPAIVVVGGAAAFMGEDQEMLSSAIGYPFLFAATALSWCVQLAAFDLLVPDDTADLEAVFA